MENMEQFQLPEGVKLIEEGFEANLNPTEEEVLEQAMILGMNPENDSDFLYIAVERLKTALPENWKACVTEDNQVWFINIETGDSCAENPLDEHFRMYFQDAKLLIQNLNDLPKFLESNQADPEAASLKMAILLSEDSNEEVKGRKVGNKTDVSELQENIQEVFQQLKIDLYDEHFNQKYEPSREDINEYAEFLGIDAQTDTEFLELVQMDLTTALPEDWKLAKLMNGEIFYFNISNGTSCWEHPLDVINQQQLDEAKGEMGMMDMQALKQQGIEGEQQPEQGMEDMISPNMAQGFYTERDQLEQPCGRYLGDEIDIGDELANSVLANAKIYNEILNPDFEPTEQMILQYAFYLGIDFEQQPGLLEYATQGLKAEIPEGWSPCITEDGQLLYFNFVEGDILQEHPIDDMIKKELKQILAVEESAQKEVSSSKKKGKEIAEIPTFQDVQKSKKKKSAKPKDIAEIPAFKPKSSKQKKQKTKTEEIPQIPAFKPRKNENQNQEVEILEESQKESVNGNLDDSILKAVLADEKLENVKFDYPGRVISEEIPIDLQEMIMIINRRQVPLSIEMAQALNQLTLRLYEEKIDPTHKPTKEEIEAYAAFIGMDPKLHKNCLWLAIQGLHHQLFEPWVACKTKKGNVLYINYETSDLIPQNPVNLHYQERFVQLQEKLAAQNKRN